MVKLTPGSSYKVLYFEPLLGVMLRLWTIGLGALLFCMNKDKIHTQEEDITRIGTPSTLFMQTMLYIYMLCCAIIAASVLLFLIDILPYMACHNWKTDRGLVQIIFEVRAIVCAKVFPRVR